MEEEEAKKIVESLTDSITSGEKKDLEDSTKDIVKKAAHAVGSLKDTEFDIRFNPDVFSPGVKHKDQDGDFFKKQCQLVKDASDFLVTVQVPVIIFQFHEKNCFFLFQVVANQKCGNKTKLLFELEHAVLTSNIWAALKFLIPEACPFAKKL